MSTTTFVKTSAFVGLGFTDHGIMTPQTIVITQQDVGNPVDPGTGVIPAVVTINWVGLSPTCKFYRVVDFSFAPGPGETGTVVTIDSNKYIAKDPLNPPWYQTWDPAAFNAGNGYGWSTPLNTTVNTNTLYTYFLVNPNTGLAWTRAQVFAITCGWVLGWHGDPHAAPTGVDEKSPFLSITDFDVAINWTAGGGGGGATGTVVVNKVIQNSSAMPNFSFSAPGFVPNAFTLTGGGSQTYTSVPVGTGYSITEAPLTNWTTVATVNPTGTNTNFAVTTGATTTLTFTNTFVNPPPPATHNVNLLTRRQRTAPHLSQEQMWVFYGQLQVDLQAGQGLVSGQGTSPVLMVDWSDDGGHTYSNEHFVTCSPIGLYRARAILRRLGRSRDRIFRVTVSDPVAWNLIGAYLKLEPGLE